MYRAKTRFLALLVIMLSMVSCGQNEPEQNDTEQNTSEETALLFSVKEIESKFDAENCKIALVNLNPCIVSDGKAYIYVDGWNEVETDHDIVTVYNGDAFSALDSEGHIIMMPEEADDYEGYPLTTAAVYDNAEELRKLTEDEKILLLSGDPLGSEHCVVYFENGYTSLFANGTAFPISDSIVVADISGDFILSEEGNSAAMGFNYGIVLCEDGNVEFHSADSALEYQISEYLAEQKEDVTAISCSYNSIAMLTSNGNVKIIDFN